MKKKDGEVSQEISLEEDMDIFEEFESGDAPDDSPTGEVHLEEDKTEPGSIIDFEGEAAEEAPADNPELKEESFEPEEIVDQDDPSDVAEETPATVALADELMKLAPDIPINIVAVIGKTMTNIGEVVKYRPGQVVDLGRPPSETVDLVANGKLIARGELVDMDGKLGVRILKLLR